MAKVARFSQDNQNPIGMIVPSMLTETQFQAINGTSWVLAAGQSVAGSVYATVTGNAAAPDLRGMTLRGKNNGRADGSQDPGGERNLGDFQNHAFQTHGHSATSSDSGHSHREFGRYSGAVGGTYGLTAFAAAGTPLVDSGDNTGNSNANITTTVNAPNSGNTDTETRMRNVAVNYFIKIN